MIEKRNFMTWVLGVIVLVGLYLTRLYSYLLFHGLAEMFSVIVACGIFMLAWNSRRLVDNSYLLFLGVAYLFIGGLDLIHTLAYKGMGVFGGYGSNLPAQLWIAARYVEALSLLLAPVFLGRKLKAAFALVGYALVTSLLLGSVFAWEIFPTCFVEGTGLTPFKKMSEYVICVILLGALGVLLRRRRELDRNVLRLLLASIVLTACSELAFTFYTDVYGFMNLLGHYLKIVSFYLIYRAVIVTGLRRPYALLFRDLKQHEEALETARDELEGRVQDRTAQLDRSIERMRQEATDRERAEEESHLLREKLDHVARAATMGELAAALAHELNQPLAGILSNAQAAQRFLAGEAPDLDEVRGALADIVDDDNRATEVIRKLRTLFEKGELERKPVDINETIREVASLVQDEIVNKNVSMELHLAADLPNILGDRVQLQQVVLNLLLNAVEAMDKAEADSAELVVRTSGEASTGVTVSVQDSGTGIEEENGERLFDAFVTTKPDGLGMGLSISRSIIEAHGGRLWCTRNPDRGSTFHFTLPSAGDDLA